MFDGTIKITILTSIYLFWKFSKYRIEFNELKLFTRTQNRSNSCFQARINSLAGFSLKTGNIKIPVVVTIWWFAPVHWILVLGSKQKLDDVFAHQNRESGFDIHSYPLFIYMSSSWWRYHDWFIKSNNYFSFRKNLAT